MEESSQLDPAYWAARESMAVAHGASRRFLEVTGKAPGDMLLGVLTSGLPEIPRGEPCGLERGKVVYSAVLDPKGRMISDLRVFSNGSGGFILDLPEAGIEGVTAHFRKFLPPRLATVADLSHEIGILTVVGPDAVSFLAEEIFAGIVAKETLELLEEGEEVVLASSPAGSIHITRNGDLSVGALDILLPRGRLEAVRGAYLDGGAVPLGRSVLELLRIEGGRPAFGIDMDESTIPVEAGIHERAIDYGKGCYTGQEVIIRIRDRGKVNKQLCRLQFGGTPVPERGQELFLPEKEKSVGWITSACFSPAFGETIGLGYLRRGVGAGDTVRLGSVTGPEVTVQSVGTEGWRLG